jgi:hypothetical protein
MEDLSKYQLKVVFELDELLAKWGKKKYSLFERAVSRLLDELPDNKWFDYRYRVHAENFEPFIKMVCDYIDTHKGCGIEFNNTFTAVRKSV